MHNNYDYDAGGAMTRVAVADTRVSYVLYDGESRTVRRDTYNSRPANGFDTIDKTEYSIYSSVLGKLLTEVKTDGTKKSTYIYSNGTLVATQIASGTSVSQHVAWESTDPSNSSYVATLSDGGILYSGERAQAELDPLGSNVGTSNPYDTGNLQAAPGGGGGWGNPFGGFSCRIDGFEAPCSLALQMLGNGSGGVDYANSNSWALNSLGIAPIYSTRYVDVAPTGPLLPGIDAVIQTTLQSYISGYHVWGFSLGNSNNEGIYDGEHRNQHGPSAQPDPPVKKPPCPYQDFNIFVTGATGATAAQLNEVVRTAVGEASVNNAFGEVIAIIQIMENMITNNSIAENSYDSRGTWRTFGKPRSGSTNLNDILGEFDAYKLHSDRGPNKLNFGPRDDDGGLALFSSACFQIIEAVSYLETTTTGFGGSILNPRNALQNRGVGARKKHIKGLNLLYTIGDTDFWTYSDMVIPRPR